jgi:hypothetical protein
VAEIDLHCCAHVPERQDGTLMVPNGALLKGIALPKAAHMRYVVSF